MINTMKRIATLEVNDSLEENVKRAFNSNNNVIVEATMIDSVNVSKEYRVYEDKENSLVISFIVQDNKVINVTLIDKFVTS